MFVFKVIILGDSASGKTTMMNNYQGKAFNENSSPTIGVEYNCKHLPMRTVLKPELQQEYDQQVSRPTGFFYRESNQRIDESIKLALWGTTGQERFHSIVTSYYRGVHGVIFVCDLTRRETYNNLDYWIEDFRKHSGVELQDVGAVIVGNKSDLADQREVTDEDIQRIAQKYQVPYFIVSSKTDTQKIKDVFNELTNCIFKVYLELPPEQRTQINTGITHLTTDKSNHYSMSKCCIIS